MGDGHAPGPSGREDVLGAGWESHRPAVFGVAYRLLGGVTDAEDVTQDVWLRAAGADLRDVGDPRAWLVTVAARRSYGILKSGLVRLPHPDAVHVTDGGGKAAAARKLIHGGERVAAVIVRVGRQWRPDRIDLAEVGGELALVFHREGRVYSVDTLQLTDGLITACRRVINPDKLPHV
ncbi:MULTISPECIES: sigma factor [Streptomyces]|uniref:Sigma-70 region 2 n=1 Tax=Streptomyces melanosporofaciens TaxID=67327 RepID=A0A1H4Z9P6_STRMJ|nr:sigma factor [Streptomyces melanosporofaciens]SED26141.1 Sigma-70 region 2 [Streptomyces melanosporofaciens]